MAKAKKRQKTNAQQTKKQLAVGRKESRQNRIILMAVGGLVGLVVIVLAAGILTELVLNPARPVARVDGVAIRTDDFEALLTYRRHNQHLTIDNLQQTIDQMDPQDETSNFLLSFYEQQMGQLNTDLVLAPDKALDELIDDVLIKQKADELGLTVTEAEITEAINKDIQTAVTQPQTGTGTEVEPTPTPISQDQIDEVLTSALQGMTLTEAQFRDIVGRSLLRAKVQEHLAGLVPTTGLVINVDLIKTETAEQSAAAQARIEAGEDFALVAKEVSTDTLTAENGGALGWVAEGQLLVRYGQAVEDAAFAATPGNSLIPVAGTDTFYLIRVTARDENGPLPEDVLSVEQNGALSNWLVERKADPAVTVERLLDEAKVPPDPFA